MPLSIEKRFTQIVDRGRRLVAQAEKAMSTTIRQGEADEISQWLSRTQWTKYLEGLERPYLVASVDKPDIETEPVNTMIWNAMDGLMRVAHNTVQSKVGLFVRMEAIRTEKHQTRYHPLQPYRNEKALSDYVRP